MTVLDPHLTRVPASKTLTKVRFGVFEADLESGELRKSGIRVKLQSQPFKVLSVLLERAGEVVSREELQQRLWGEQTTVDFDHALGTAINKIREALGDSADNPIFVETLSRRGYRFIAPVAPTVAEPAEVEAPVDSTPAVRPRMPAPANSLWPYGVLGAGLALFLSALLLLVAAAHRSWQAPLRISQVTYSGRVSPGEPLLESLPGAATDGSRLYFLQIEDARAVLAQALIADGETSLLRVPAEIAAPSLGDISPDGSKLIVRNHLAAESEQPLWVLPTLGGAARRIANAVAHDATWMPDGQRILYATGNDLLITRENGTGSEKFAGLPGRAFWLRWSPDGTHLRFTLLNSEKHTTELWQIDAKGRGLHPLLPGWSTPAEECCGSWTWDGKYFVFQSTRDGLSNIWALDEGRSWMPGRPRPLEITNGPLSFAAPITARSGHKIFFMGLNARTELLQYQGATRQFLPYGKNLDVAIRAEFSRDGHWVAWIKPGERSLWRSRADSSERMQLTEPPMQVFMMHWAPDGKRLVVMARAPGEPWQLSIVDAAGGTLQPVYKEARNQADPDWSPDGRSLVFGRLPELMADERQPKAIYIENLATKRIETIPGSEGLFSPRWSPDGRYIAALTLDQHRMMLYDTAAKRWAQLVEHDAADPVWAHDGKSIFFHDFVDDSQPIYRVSVPDGVLAQVAGLSDLQSTEVVDYRFAGLAPGDVPLVSARLSTANIYSVDLDQR